MLIKDLLKKTTIPTINYQRLLEKQSHITNLLEFKLHEYFSDLLNKGIISMGHARALVGKNRKT